LKLLLLLIFITVSFSTFAANEDLPIFKVESESTDSGKKMIIETILIDKNLENEKLVEWSAKNLKESEISAIQVILTENEKNNQAVELFLLKLKFRLGMAQHISSKKISEYRVNINEEAKKLAGNSKKFFEKHERISLSLLRTVVNGATVSTGLIINGGVQPEVGLAIGFFSGSLSGIFQYWNASFQQLIDGNHERNQEIIKTKKYGNTLIKTTQMTKWFFVEVSLYALIKTFTHALNVPMGSFMAEAIVVLKSSAMATASQGLWDSTIASETRSALRDAEGNPTEQARIQRASNVKTFAVSMASVFGGVMSLMGANIGSVSLGALGVSGVIYTYFSYRNSTSKPELGWRPISPNCRSVFAL